MQDTLFLVSTVCFALFLLVCQGKVEQLYIITGRKHKRGKVLFDIIIYFSIFTLCFLAFALVLYDIPFSDLFSYIRVSDWQCWVALIASFVIIVSDWLVTSIMVKDLIKTIPQEQGDNNMNSNGFHWSGEDVSELKPVIAHSLSSYGLNPSEYLGEYLDSYKEQLNAHTGFEPLSVVRSSSFREVLNRHTGIFRENIVSRTPADIKKFLDMQRVLPHVGYRRLVASEG